MSTIQGTPGPPPGGGRRGWAIILGGLAIGAAASFPAFSAGKARRIEAVAAEARRAVKTGKIEAARGLVDRWSAMAPRDGEADYYRAWIETKAPRPIEALGAMKSAAAKGYPDGPLLALRAVLMALAGKYEEALPSLRTAAREDMGPAAEIADGLARCYLHGLQLAEADAVLARWKRVAPDDARPHVWQAEVDRRLGREDDVVVPDYLEALQLNPDLDEVRFDVAETLLKNAQLDDAERHFDAMLARRPKDVRSLVGKGKIKLLRGDIQGATSDFELAFDSDPKSPQALRELAALDLQFGRTKQACGRLAKAIDLEPEDLEMRYTYARALGALNDPAGAAEQTRAVERLRSDQKQIEMLRNRLAGDPTNLDVRCEIAKWLTEHGHEQEGVDSTRYLLSVSSQHPATCRFLADYYAKKGKPGLANYYRLLAP